MATQNPNPQSKIRAPNAESRDDGGSLERTPQRQPNSPKSRSGVADEVASVASGLAKDAGRSASKLASDVTDAVRDAAEDRKDRGARSIEGVADAVRDAADDLDGEVPYVSDYVRQAAEALSDFSQAIRDRSVGDLVDTVSDFARRQPTAFFAGSVLAGVVASRFLKSSAPRPGPGRYQPGRPPQRERSASVQPHAVGTTDGPSKKARPAGVRQNGARGRGQTKG